MRPGKAKTRRQSHISFFEIDERCLLKDIITKLRVEK
jgi:hypothetical protein